MITGDACVSKTVTGWDCVLEGRWAWGSYLGRRVCFKKKDNTVMSEPDKQGGRA